MTIVVGVDGSESALRASRWAAREAVLRDTDLRLVHVRQLPLLLPPTDLYAERLAAQGHAWLTAARDQALTAAPTVTVHSGLRTGQPGVELVAESENAELVVVGSRGLGGFRSLLLGSVANALTAHGHCPVVVLRGRTAGAPAPEQGPVVVGADGTPPNASVLEFAVRAAVARGVELVAVHAWTYEGLADAAPPASSTPPGAIGWDAIAATQRRTLDDQLATVRAAHPDATARAAHVRGRPVDGILAQAEHAQLVVVGSNGRHPAVAGAIGSTSYAVLHHATCPVAVVPLRRRP